MEQIESGDQSSSTMEESGDRLVNKLSSPWIKGKGEKKN